FTDPDSDRARGQDLESLAIGEDVEPVDADERGATHRVTSCANSATSRSRAMIGGRLSGACCPSATPPGPPALVGMAAVLLSSSSGWCSLPVGLLPAYPLGNHPRTPGAEVIAAKRAILREVSEVSVRIPSRNVSDRLDLDLGLVRHLKAQQLLGHRVDLRPM